MAKRFTPKVVDALLDKLSTDDDFRALMVKDPREALRQVGHETPPEDMNIAGADPVMCCQVTSLASKEQFRTSRQMLRDRFLIQDKFSYFDV